MEFLPSSCLQEIASHLDKNAMRNLKIVNAAWHSALADSNFWLNMCKRDRRHMPSLLFRQGIAKINEVWEKKTIGIDYERIWVHDPFSVIKEKERCVGDYNMEPDKLDNGISMECPPKNCVQSPMLPSCYNGAGPYGRWKNNVIVLSDYGIPNWIMDSIRPRIVVSQWTTPTTGKKGRFSLTGTLRSDYTSVGFRVFAFKIFAANQRLTKWSKVEIVLEKYQRGMRELIILSTVDQGQKMAKLEIRVELPEEFKWIGQIRKRKENVKRAEKKVEKKIDVEEKKDKNEEKRRAKRKIAPVQQTELRRSKRVKKDE